MKALCVFFFLSVWCFFLLLRGREGERIWSRLCADSRETDAGLELTTCEIITWAKVGWMLNRLSHPGALLWMFSDILWPLIQLYTCALTSRSSKKYVVFQSPLGISRFPSICFNFCPISYSSQLVSPLHAAAVFNSCYWLFLTNTLGVRTFPPERTQNRIK